MINITNYVDFIVRNNLTQAQFLLLSCLYQGKIKEITAYSKAFPSEDGTFIGRVFIDDLIEREFVEQDSKGNYKVTEKFKSIFIDKDLAAIDFARAYPPSYRDIQGNTIAIARPNHSILAKEYWSAINGDNEEHNQVLEDLAYMHARGYVQYTMITCVQYRCWMEYRLERLAHQLGEKRTEI